MMADTYREKCREIGSLGATFPVLVRNICRTRIDGTHISVMEAQRAITMKRLEKFTSKYDFCKVYYTRLDEYEAHRIYALICDIITTYKPRAKSINQQAGFECRMENCTCMPKVACLACKMPRLVIEKMEEYG